jgi:hypothetical protein
MAELPKDEPFDMLGHLLLRGMRRMKKQPLVNTALMTGRIRKVRM